MTRLKCVISFVDFYAKNKRNMKAMGAYELEEAALEDFARSISKIAGVHGMMVSSCAESMDLAQCGIEHNCCIDKALIEDIIGCKINAGKDRNQRLECGCVDSVMKNCSEYDAKSPLLCGNITKEDTICERRVKALRQEQLSFFI